MTWATNHYRREVWNRKTKTLTSREEYYMPLLDWLVETFPLGRPGDRIWVKEGWCNRVEDDRVLADRFWYRADGEDVRKIDGDGFAVFRKDGRPASPWRPSTQMPRAACRLILEIRTVRAQRLQEISHEDALAEGCRGTNWVERSPYISGPHTDDGELPQEEFARMWDVTHPKRLGWDANPLVRAVSFLVVPNERAPRA